MSFITRITPLVLLLSGGCSDVEGDGDDGHGHSHNENEVITTLTLSFAPQSGGSAMEFTWTDPEDDGDPVIDDIVLTNGEDYDLTLTMFNNLEDPPEELTQEIADENDEHQFFFTGSGVQGPATGTNADAVIEHAYSDTDPGGLPVGLQNTISTLGTGTGELSITLRHLPEESGEAVKVAGLADDVASGGFAAIGGDNDISVTFDIEVE